MAMNFGERLRMARYNAGLTQTELADKASTPTMRIWTSTISRMENGVIPSAKILVAVAAALGESCDSLLGNEPKDTDEALSTEFYINRLTLMAGKLLSAAEKLAQGQKALA